MLDGMRRRSSCTLFDGMGWMCGVSLLFCVKLSFVYSIKMSINEFICEYNFK